MTFKETLQKRAKKSNSVKILNKISFYDIILKPITTEKSYKQNEKLNKYYFKIHKDANKNDVKYAIEKIYWVKPKAINLINVPYKWRARRSLVRRAYKKAIVTLKQWDKIDIIK